MATTALVGIEQKDGTIKYRKVYSDGYLSHTGVYLLKHLNTPRAIKAFKVGDYGLNCSDIKIAKNEEEFLKSWDFVCEHYLYRKGKWYNGNWYYYDGWLYDPLTGERTRKARDEEFYCERNWELLEPKFIKKRRVVYDYIEIENEEE